MTALRQSPLADHHVALGARLAEFGGWRMPLRYSGVLAEHAAVREAVGVFDVSHLGKVDVRGTGAAEFINACLTNDLGRIAAGQAQYTLCCDEGTGGIIDDLIAYLHGPDRVFLVPNAANAAEVARRLRTAAPAGVTVTDQHEAYGVLAVQGPRSAELLDRLGLPHDHAYLSFVETTGQRRPLVVCRTGYTGEHGYELLPAAADAGRLWDALLSTGADLGVLPCGLGARDTLRTELGYPLHGADLSPEVTPVQARLGWAVGWSKPAFWGRAVLLAERDAGPTRLLRGLEALGPGIPRPGMRVRDAAGADIGQVTSGTFSPTRRIGVALALLAAGTVTGDEVSVDVRGRPSPMRVVTPPFVPSSVR